MGVGRRPLSWASRRGVSRFHRGRFMKDPDWLLLLSGDGTVEAVDGGAPLEWVSRRVDACAGLPAEVLAAADELVREIARLRPRAPARHVHVASEAPGLPSFTLLTVEG